MFEKVATQHTNCTNGVTFQRLKTLNDNQVIKGLIAVITVEPSINYSFVLTDMQPRLMGQNNEKMTLSPRLHVKPLVTVITAIKDKKKLADAKRQQGYPYKHSSTLQHLYTNCQTGK